MKFETKDHSLAHHTGLNTKLECFNKELKSGLPYQTAQTTT